jgi:hypothetical protein
VTALRQGSLKYIEPSGGPKMSQYTNVELGQSEAGQLYDLAKDGGEQNNLNQEKPDDTKELGERLTELRQAGRSR